MLHFSIVTPDGVAYEDSVKQVSIPTVSGEITVLPHHIPLISALKSGELRIVKNDGTEVILAVAHGVLEVKGEDKIVVLTDTAERAEQIDLDKAEAARVRAEQLLKETKAVDEVQFARIQASLDREMAKLRVGRKYRKLPPVS